MEAVCVEDSMGWTPPVSEMFVHTRARAQGETIALTIAREESKDTHSEKNTTHMSSEQVRDTQASRNDAGKKACRLAQNTHCMDAYWDGDPGRYGIRPLAYAASWMWRGI